MRLQIRTGLTGPSSKKSISACVGDRAAVLVVDVGERVRAADHALGRDAVDLLGDRPHEVAVAARGDVVREPVRLEVAEELDHRHVAALVERPAEGRVLPAAQEGVGGARVVLDALAGERLEDAAHQHLHVAVVAVVVLRDRLAEPGVVLLVRGLPRLSCPQRLVLLGHLGEAPEDEAELDRHRLLAPERAVVVEDGDPLGGRDVVRPALGRHPLDEVDDRRLRRAVRASVSSPAGISRARMPPAPPSRGRRTVLPLTSIAACWIVPPTNGHGYSPG